MTPAEAARHRDLADSLAQFLYPHGEWPVSRGSFLEDRLATLETAVLIARIDGSGNLPMMKAMRQVLQGLADVTRLQIAAASAIQSAELDGHRP
ncbi:hypothetical protein [Sphingomonas bisphenolicum]|uniref:Uncharacterized protein n=1 Tax=Sphingomonas bisphenolicum TaxID=296544 RepID=A0ABM7FYJ4_9SPHN|nr:hypothetical protein [Sphingomonas bisphenolicum]BBF70215.1 hypothetical protein SBA_ch1_24150 [Sphingomonas bisphenolicum]